MGERRRAWFQRFKEIYSVRGTDGRGNCYKGSAYSWIKIS